MLSKFIAKLLTPPPAPRQAPDLQRYNEARERLHRASTHLSREADAFAELVHDMRADPTASPKKKRSEPKKKKAPT